ncbi:hypothetical protein SDC9_210678 [bioreactor metagenome]|uniref:Uncharacterized protein n=1 Tax=bioreactor metagenome TaxID=1076179 RepID=A0A645JGX4_9ZZZZ
MVEPDRHLRRTARGLCKCRLADRGFGMQQFEQPAGGTGRAHHVAPHLGQGTGPSGHQRRIQDEGRQLATAEAAGPDLLGADPEYEDDRTHHRRNDHCRQHRTHPGTADGGGKAGLATFGEATRLARLLGEGLHRGHGVEDLASQRRGIGNAVLRLA